MFLGQTCILISLFLLLSTGLYLWLQKSNSVFVTLKSILVWMMIFFMLTIAMMQTHTHTHTHTHTIYSLHIQKKVRCRRTCLVLLCEPDAAAIIKINPSWPQPNYSMLFSHVRLFWGSACYLLQKASI